MQARADSSRGGTRRGATALAIVMAMTLVASMLTAFGTPAGAHEGENTAPVAVRDVVDLNFSPGVWTIFPMDNDSDLDGDRISITAVAAAQHGLVAVEAGQYLTYRPEVGFVGVDSFSYTIEDEHGAQAIGNVVVYVDTDAPSAVDDVATATQDSPMWIEVVANDLGAVGTSLTVVETAGVACPGGMTSEGGRVGCSNALGSVSYTPPAGFAGIDTFTYTIQDNYGTRSTASVTVTVEAVHQPPVAVDDVATTLVDMSIFIEVLGNDSGQDGSSLRLVGVEGDDCPGEGWTATGARVVCPETVLERGVDYQPAPGFVGEDSFTYTIEDDYGNRATATVTVTVEDLRVVPFGEIATTPQGTAVLIDLTEDDQLDKVIGSLDGMHGTTISYDGLTVLYRPDPDFVGVDSFQYGIDGRDQYQATAVVYVGTSPPEAVDDAATTSVNTSIDIDVLANDAVPDGTETVLVSVAGRECGTAFNLDGVQHCEGNGIVHYAPDPGFVGDDVFSYTIEDAFGTRSTATVTVTVEAANQLPVAMDDVATTSQDTGVNIDVLENDSDPDGDLTIVEVTGAQHGGASLATFGSGVDYQPDDGFVGVDTFSYTIEDFDGAQASATVVVYVGTPPPTAVDDVVTTTLNTPIVIDLLANDALPEGAMTLVDEVAGTLCSTPLISTDLGFLQCGAAGDILYNPTGVGEDSFSYTIEDNYGTRSTAMVTVTVVDPCLELSVDAELVAVVEGQVATATGSVAESGRDCVESMSASVGDVQFSEDGSWSWSWLASDGPTDSQEVTISAVDDQGETQSVTFDLSVANVAPAATIDPGQITVIDEGGIVTVTAEFRDPGWKDTHTAIVDWGVPSGYDGVELAAPSIRVAVDGGPGNSLVGRVTASYQYGDNDDGDGFTITVTVTDDDGGSGTVGVDVTVANVDPSVDIDDQDTLITSLGEAVALSAAVADPGSDDLTGVWDYGDGSTESATSLVNPPDVDPAPSPTVQPRGMTFYGSHAFDGACVYHVEVEVTDDDGGLGADSVDVVVTGGSDRARGSGYWATEYGKRRRADFTAETLDCYLAIVNHMSPVFSETVTLETLKDVESVLKPREPSTAAQRFDSQLLAAWLNFANGAYGLDTMVDTTGDGVPDSAFGAFLAQAEAARIDSATSDAELTELKDILERLNLADDEPQTSGEVIPVSSVKPIRHRGLPVAGAGDLAVQTNAACLFMIAGIAATRAARRRRVR